MISSQVCVVLFVFSVGTMIMTTWIRRLFSRAFRIWAFSVCPLTKWSQTLNPVLTSLQHQRRDFLGSSALSALREDKGGTSILARFILKFHHCQDLEKINCFSWKWYRTSLKFTILGELKTSLKGVCVCMYVCAATFSKPKGWAMLVRRVRGFPPGPF